MDDARSEGTLAADASSREHERQRRLAALAAEISARLRGPCSHMLDEQFGAMVLDIALMQLRFREIEARDVS